MLDHKIGYHADIRQKEAGISVRDYFAAKAMQVYLSQDRPPREAPPISYAEISYEMADAMLAARAAK
ncbi:hypothetical protein FQ179_01880 [Pusillimonas sp. ANT_WB101]|nr:hypothetical protein FQ179_01880 [Pusillimonas sp. ANT_WB101]